MRARVKAMCCAFRMRKCSAPSMPDRLLDAPSTHSIPAMVSFDRKYVRACRLNQTLALFPARTKILFLEKGNLIAKTGP